MTTVPNEPESAEAGIEDLLREVGARDEPSPDTMQEVRTAVHAEWQSMVAERRRQRRAMGWRIAASLALAILIATFAARYVTPQPVQVATVANITGQLLAATGAGHATGDPVVVGETVRTDERSRAALSFPDGLSLRLDRNTRIQIAAADSVELISGAIYIDSPSANAGDAALTVETHAGSVRHLGTQYEVRTHAGGIVVSVREGRVVVSSERGSNTAEAGEMLRLNTGGELSRHSIAASDPSWQWATAAAPVFDIDNQSLAAFLQWTARETGRRVVYSSPEVAANAAAIKLRGSIAGMDADAALAAVLATTELRRYRAADEEIGIEMAGN
jgi:ferric-dicitrate binding protein FerR (iron transport regulator)